MTSTLERVTLPDVPALEPEDNRRATVREWRRDVAAWLRDAAGVAAHGEPWDLATTGVRDLVELRRAAAAVDGMARHWSGVVPAAALVAGDMTPHGLVTGETVTDPDTGRVWVTTSRTTSGATDHDTVAAVVRVTDVELEPAELVTVTRGKGAR